MAYLAVINLKTHLYEEIQDEIVRGDQAILQEAIDVAMSEAAGYLTKYDMQKEFHEVDVNDRNKKLQAVILDIATWHVIRLSNPNIELSYRKQLYDYAIEWLKGVQKGAIEPNLPYPQAPEGGEGVYGNLSGGIKWESNPKRNNHF